jgi:diacylglycerol kinase family enzyme
MDLFLENKVISGDFIYGMITNTTSIGGIHGITGKSVVLNDGKFEGVFIKNPHNFMDFVNIIQDLRKGNLNTEYILSFPINRISIRSQDLVPWCIDGEYGGSMQEVNIKNNFQEITIASLLGGKQDFNAI